MDCCTCCSRLLLAIINVIFLLLGLVPLVFGIIAEVSDKIINQVVELLVGFLPEAKFIANVVADIIKDYSVFMIVIGSVIVVIGLLGCCGACFKVKFMLITYLILVILIVLAEVAIIIAATCYPEQFNKAGKKLLRDQLENFKYDCEVTNVTVDCNSGGDSTTIGWHALQYEVKCCGAEGIDDYGEISWTKRDPDAVAPVSCCKHSPGDFNNGSIAVDPNDGECFTTGAVPDGYYSTGCFLALMSKIIANPVAIGVMAGIGAFEIILIVMTIVIMCQKDTNKVS